MKIKKKKINKRMHQKLIENRQMEFASRKALLDVGSVDVGVGL